MVLIATLSLCLCVIWASALEPLDEDFSPDQLKGKWWLVGVASNSPYHTDFVDYWGSALYNIALQDGGNMTIIYKLGMGQCRVISEEAEKTITPGQFTVSDLKFLLTYNFLFVKEDEYTLCHNNRKMASGGTNDVYLLLTRAKTPSPELVQEFKDYASELKIPEKFTVMVSPEGVKCFDKE